MKDILEYNSMQYILEEMSWEIYRKMQLLVDISFDKI